MSESFNDYVVFDIETAKKFYTGFGDNDYYNIVYSSDSDTEAEQAVVTEEVTVEVGDKLYDYVVGMAEVIYISDFEQILVKYSDGSVNLFENFAEAEAAGFTKLFETDGWINVIRDTNSNEIFFDDSVYVTRQNAVNAFERDKHSGWELLDTTHISWSNKNV